MGLSVWRETSKKLTVCRELFEEKLSVHREIAKFLTVYRVCYTPIETLMHLPDFTLSVSLHHLAASLIVLTRDIYDITPSTSASFFSH